MPRVLDMVNIARKYLGLLENLRGGLSWLKIEASSVSKGQES